LNLIVYQVTVCVEVAVLLFHQLRSKLLCLVLSLNLLVNVLLLPLYNYRKRLERLIENWRRYKLPSLHFTLIADKVAIVGLVLSTTLIFLVAILVIVPFVISNDKIY
jgi:hypothetical protein